MGDEVRCTLRLGDSVSEGQALLETDELVFRGETRLAIPFREITSIEADDGRLVLGFRGERATLELEGRSAARWAEKIRNPKTLLGKLGVGRETRVSVVGVHDEPFRRLLGESGAEVAYDEALPGSDAVFLGAESVADLDRLRDLERFLARDGAVWVVAPKGGREPRESEVLKVGRSAGLVDTKVVRFSDSHTAHRFVIPKARR